MDSLYSFSAPLQSWLSDLSSRSTLGLSMLGALTVLTVFEVKRRRASGHGLPLPPGPKGLPVIGNLHQFPQDKPWEVYVRWAQEYGNLILLNLMGQKILIVNTLEDITGILENNTASTADRPWMPTIEMLGLSSLNMAVMPYGPDFRAHRKAFHQNLISSQIPKYHPVIEEEVTSALKDLVDKPHDFIHWSRRLVSHIMMRISYGVKDFRYNEELVNQAEEYMDRVSESAVQGRYLVDAFPWLRFVPDWFPGTAWKRRLREGAALGDAIAIRPYQEALQRAREGKLTNDYHSIVSVLIESTPPEDHPDFVQMNRVAMNVSATSYTSGTDTTTFSLQTLFLALAMYPEAQWKAQQEIDRLTENGSRLPRASDLEHLPYVRALLKELARWHPVAPLGVFHKTMEDVVYKGQVIPNGTIIIPNIWSITRETKYFDQPEEFIPERYLIVTKNADGSLHYEEDPSTLDSSVVFGFGRRICPGRFLSKDTVGCIAMNILALFDVSESKTRGGKLKLDPTTGLGSKPCPNFTVDIKPRSSRHLALIQ